MIKIHKEGYKIIGTTALVLALINCAVLIPFPIVNPVLIGIIIGISVICVIAVALFFRVPNRVIPLFSDDEIVAPADGKVVVIEEVFEKEFFNERRIQVSIFMSVLNVHVNLFPMNGEVTRVHYFSGDYLLAWHPKSSEDNERNKIVIRNKRHEVMFQQIAGFVARKIVNYAKVGDPAQAGKSFGMIKFGSRVDVFLPIDAKVNVSLNERVVGGKTIIANL